MPLKNKKQFFARHIFYTSLFPSLISAAALSAADIADSVVIGNRMGEQGLAAIGIVTPVYMVYNILGYGLSIGGEVTHARLIASGKEEEAGKHFNVLLWTGLLAGFALAAVGIVFFRRILIFLSADPADRYLFDLCCRYYLPLAGAAPLFIVNYLFYDLLRADEDPRLASLAFTAGCVCDLVLNIVFVLILHMGAGGAVIATIIAQAVTAVISMLHFFLKRGALRISRPSFGFRTCLSDFKIGGASSVRYLFQFVFITMANNLLMKSSAGIGAVNVAVFDLVMNVSYVSYSMFEGTGAAIQPLVSALCEEKDLPGIIYIKKTGFNWGMACGTAAAFMIALLARPIAFFFGIKEPASLVVAIPAIHIFCFSVPFAGIIILWINYYQAVGKEKLAALLTTLRTCIVLLPLTFLIGHFYAERFWMVFPVSELISLGIGFLVIRATKADNVLDKVPVMSVTLENQSHEIAELLSDTERFCAENGASRKQSNLLYMAVEEICMATIAKAFTGDENEYIQVTLTAEVNDKFTLLIRNSAKRFNPFDMRTGKVTGQEEEELLDSIGILYIKKKADRFFYRRSDRFNILTVVI